MYGNHLQFRIHLKCNRCNRRSSKTLVLKIGDYRYIGCKECKSTTTTFRASRFIAWNSHCDDLEVRATR